MEGDLYFNISCLGSGKIIWVKYRGVLFPQFCLLFCLKIRSSGDSIFSIYACILAGIALYMQLCV